MPARPTALVIGALVGGFALGVVVGTVARARGETDALRDCVSASFQGTVDRAAAIGALEDCLQRSKLIDSALSSP